MFSWNTWRDHLYHLKLFLLHIFLSTLSPSLLPTSPLHLRKCQRPEAENSEKEDIEGPEEDDEGVEVVVEACKEECEDGFTYMERRGNCAEKDCFRILIVLQLVIFDYVGPTLFLVHSIIGL